MVATWTSTARLLRRTGFGTTGTAVDAVLGTDLPRYVAGLLAADPTRDPGALSTPAPTFPALPHAGASAGTASRKARDAALREQLTALTSWWIRRMTTVHQPFGEKLTFIWHGHFATSAQKVRNADWMLTQNQRLRTLGRGEFPSLAATMLTDAATLRWLDGDKNTAAAPNENLSREFMEIFTLGHDDGYSEADVRSGARALTGWRINADGTTSERPSLHDDGVKTFLGVTGNLDATGYCAAVLSRPGCAPFIASRLWQALGSGSTPSAALLDQLVAAYGSGQDVSALLRTILTVPEFAQAQGSLVIGPVEWLIGLARSLHTPVATDADVRPLGAVLRQLGQLPFYPPSVGGWPSGQAWMSTAAADVRFRAAAKMAAGADLSTISGTPTQRVEATAYLLGVAGWSARSAAALTAQAGDPARLVATAANAPEYLVH